MPLFSASTFRIIGSAATTQNLFTISNTTAGVTIKIRRLLIQMDATSVLTTFMPLMKTSRVSVAPTGGTLLTPCPFITGNTPIAVVRAANASDGGSATAITATPGTIAWQQYCMRLHTAVGQVLSQDNNLLPYLVESVDFTLVNGESLLVRVVAAATTSNPSTNHYSVECAWEEV